MKKLIFATFIIIGLALIAADLDIELVKNYILNFRDSHALLITLICTLVYSIMLAIPFVAGAELGILMMVLLGTPGIIGAYLGTIIGLSSAYYFGSTSNIENKKLKKVLENTFKNFSQYIPRWAALAILINLPGNTALGGGGGIAMAFGAEKKLGAIKFLTVILIATLPVPTLFYFGLIQLNA